ncbi:hypothetical protein BCY91_01200 [Pelobium manganitolerans]|uniref:YetF C-terminal domain-containing protein n=1 Tax=Pelobium manganitolerans TaxID=1842495 RepID=A0A419SBT5_9SPHI|nr:YetF domain-containing protein [Pelobium manganitolerans]RKD20268.1 hypothetical protein BCY91_01200 [Pelobium manganitolerans]
MKEVFNLDRLLMNGLPYAFLLEVLLRCVVMYITALIVLKSAGRRGVKQLSVFELVIILTLGSAAGDPLFYEDVGLIPAICVFTFILALYRFTTYLISRSENVEVWLEGKPIYLIRNGQFSIEEFAKEPLALDEFFAELRLRNVSHIGQVDLAILETNGQISVFFFKDEDVRAGLPILPHLFNKEVKIFEPNKVYACKFCANTSKTAAVQTELVCNRCEKERWVLALDSKRVG